MTLQSIATLIDDETPLDSPATSPRNYLATAAWLKACGKEPSPEGLSTQIGCHFEEMAEFMDSVSIESNTGLAATTLNEISAVLKAVATTLKLGNAKALIYDREGALDALCDTEVTGNGVAYMAGFKKTLADADVIASLWAKLNEDGTPVILPGGKIGKRPGWCAPDLTGYV